VDCAKTKKGGYEQYRAPITDEALKAAGDVVPHAIRVVYPGVLVDN